MVYLFALLWAAAFGYQLLALISLWRFFAQGPPAQARPPYPGVTVLISVRGREEATRACLESFLTQDYHPYQVLFGVADPQDPVLPLLEELQVAFPQAAVDLMVCPEKLGHNPKISVLRQLEGQARHEVLVLADADVQVAPDFLSRTVAALAEPGVGLVTCPYRAGPAHTLGAQLEALTISADFIPSVAVAYYLEGIRFALGAAMVLPRRVLAEIGGLAALADFLADDYQLGRRVADAGYRVRLLPYVVETENPRLSLRAYLAHQLRWARTYRVCRPKGYLGYGITHALVYALALCLASGPAPYALGLLGLTLAGRWALAYFAERRCLQGRLSGAALGLLPLKDILSFGLWLASFGGNRVTWQTDHFRVSREGKLLPKCSCL